MMQFNRIALGRQAKELGFVRDTLEKVYRLADALSFMEKDEILSETLALKGGTAINLTIFDLPRLSVDIDLDYVGKLPRDEMLSQREILTERIHKYISAAGYIKSVKAKEYHALDSFIYEYQNAGGVKDNLKIEINYMLRCHVLPVVHRKVNLPLNKAELTVLSVAPVEIFASKTVALLNRTAPRDLYDLYNMLNLGLFDESQEEMLRKCIIFYSAVGSEKISYSFRFDSLSQISQQKIKTDLLPVLRNDEHFDLQSAVEQITEYLDVLLKLQGKESEFLKAFAAGRYNPELLFTEEEILSRISSHPMALWKCQKNRNDIER